MAATRQALSVNVAPDGAFVLNGELDLSTVRELRDLVDEVMAPGHDIVLDLAQLTFVDMSAIHWLVEMSDATGRPVVLRNASPLVRHIFELAATLGPDGDAWVFEDHPADSPLPS